MKTPKKKITKRMIENWRAYENVRKGGAFNMFDPRARQLTGLSRSDYIFCMDNWNELRLAAKDE